ncbi:MAG: DNA alkylation repair protein [Spirochaetales bacterium]|nr:DNA alkylation repair protein [Spirochaetales bacterium]
MDIINSIKDEIKDYIVDGKAEKLEKYFKTGVGEYGEGDRFLGVNVPNLRAIAKKHYKDLSLGDTEELLTEKFHEYRHLALLILVLKYESGDEYLKESIKEIYLNHTKYINNWDLVDCSAPNIVGEFWYRKKDRHELLRLTDSESIWEQRIAILSTFYFIKQNHFDLTYMLCRKFFKSKEPLIHKACGWMLREAGKRDISFLINFLNHFALQMPSIMFQYSTEKLEKAEKEIYKELRNTGKYL